MSPEPIIALQRRLTIAGAIRAGGEKPERGVGRKLEAFRLTSPRRDLVEQASRLYGGEVAPWKSPVGDEFQVYTEAEFLPVLLMPSYSLRQTYELWEGATKRTRLCDGVEEELTGGPCICNAEGVDRCDLYSRLVVALPELDSVLGWRLITRGANAAHELPTMTALAERVGSGSTFVPARLRLDSRRGVKDGQVVRFVVPVLDLGVGYLALAGGVADGTRPALPAPGDAPAALPRQTVEDALEGVARPVTTGADRAATSSGDEAPAEAPAEAPPPPSNEGAKPEEAQTRAPSASMLTRLNMLVGGLRTGGWITTESVWAGIAKLRKLDVGIMEDLIAGARDDDGVLHWAPLRDTLDRVEAGQLRDWLEEKQRRVDAGQAQPVAAAAGGERQWSAPQGPGELPPGY